MSDLRPIIYSKEAVSLQNAYHAYSDPRCLARFQGALFIVSAFAAAFFSSLGYFLQGVWLGISLIPFSLVESQGELKESVSLSLDAFKRGALYLQALVLGYFSPKKACDKIAKCLRPLWLERQETKRQEALIGNMQGKMILLERESAESSERYEEDLAALKQALEDIQETLKENETLSSTPVSTPARRFPHRVLPLGPQGVETPMCVQREGGGSCEEVPSTPQRDAEAVELGKYVDDLIQHTKRMLEKTGKTPSRNRSHHS